MDPMVWNKDLAQKNISKKYNKEKYIKQINDTWEWLNSAVLAEFCRLGGKGHVWKKSGVTTLGEEGGEVGMFLLGNDKNNVVADKFFLLFLVNNNCYFLLGNADSLKISVLSFLMKYIYRSSIV